MSGPTAHHAEEGILYRPLEASIVRMARAAKRLGLLVGAIVVFSLVVTANSRDPAERLLLVGFSALPMLAPAYMAWTASRLRRAFVHVKPESLSYELPRSAGAFRWDDVARVYFSGIDMTNRAHRSLDLTIILTTGENQRMRLPSHQWDAGLAVAAHVMRAAANNIGPEARQAFDEGSKLGFGPVHVSDRGIQVKKKWFDWADVTSLRFEDGLLAVNDDQKRFLRTVVPVRKIPNALVMAELVSEHMDEPPAFAELVNKVVVAGSAGRSHF